MLRRVIWLLVFLLSLGALTYAYVAGASIPVLQPQGPVAAGERSVIIITLLLCAIVVVPVFVMLFYFAWKYRASNPDSHKHHVPEWDHLSGTAEFVWWLVPTAIVVVLGVLAWQSSHALDPYKPLAGSAPPLEVEVVALDWKWLFIYPQQHIATVNMLELPVGTPVHFDITADAPMNSFWIPSLGGQIMAMPGMSTQLNLLASNAGTFRGLSGNISGRGFAGMSFAVQSVLEQTFAAWVAGVAQTQNPLTLPVYTALSKDSIYNPPAYYSAVDQNLYTTIINKFMIPASESSTSAMPGMHM